MRWIVAATLLACGARTELADRGPSDASIDVPTADVAASDASPQPPPPPFLTGLDNPYSIAVDDANVYFTNSPMSGPAHAFACAKSGCNDQPTMLGTGNEGSLLALDAARLFWVSKNDVVACELGGCAQQPNVVGQAGGSVFGVGRAKDRLAWTVTGYAKGVVQLCTLPSCATTTTTLADAQVAAAYVALDDTNVYWTNWINNTGSVMQCALAGCNDQPLLLAYDISGPSRLVVDAKNVYWLSGDGSILRCAIGGCGMQPSPVYSSPHQTTQSNALAIDNGWLYWPSDSGIVKCPVSGCVGQPMVVAPANGEVYGIAVDATDVYFTVAVGGPKNGGAIIKHPK